MLSKHIFFFLIILFPRTLFAQDKFQLSSPIAKYKSPFFKDSATISFLYAQPGAEIHYTDNNSEPAESDKIYHGPILIKKSSVIKAKVFGRDFLPSETVTVEFQEAGKQIISAETKEDHTEYPGNGPSTLFDNEGGNIDAGARSWMGFKVDSIRIEIKIAKKEKISEVLLSVLQNQSGWIFIPEKIEILIPGTVDKIIGQSGFDATKQSGENKISFLRVKLSESIETDFLVVRIYPVKSLPEWHTAKGKHAWFFIDEIKLY